MIIIEQRPDKPSRKRWSKEMVEKGKCCASFVAPCSAILPFDQGTVLLIKRFLCIAVAKVYRLKKENQSELEAL